MRPIFAEPAWLLLLLLVPLALLGRVRQGYRRRAEWRALGQSSPLYSTGSGAWLVAWVALVLALAGPRWGRRPGDDPPPGHDLVLLIDVSRSMGAEDAVPSRLALARDAARSLIASLEDESGDRAAVVAFAARGVVRCPLTGNGSAVGDAIEALQAGGVEPGGTDLGAGLNAAVDLLEVDAPHAEGRAVVVFSDGEDHAATWSDAIARLTAAGAVVHVVAIGNPDQAVPVPSLATAVDPPPTTRRVDTVLRQLTDATGGTFVPLGVARGDLGTLYRDQIRPMTRHPIPEPRFSERAERFGLFLSVALGAALLGSRTPRRPRLRPRRPLSGSIPPRTRSWRRVAWALAVAGTLLALLLGARGAGGEGAPGDESDAEAKAEAANRLGLAAFESGQFVAALPAFEAARAARPEGAVAHFNLGLTLAALHRWDEAEACFQAARDRADADLRLRVDYALGNACALAGRFAEAVNHYDACLATEADRPGLDTIREDARVNREAVLARLRGETQTPDRDSGRGDDSQPREAPRPPGDPGADPEAQSSAADPKPNAPNGPGGRNPRGSNPRRRGPGGFGGSGAAPEAETPDERLSAALRRIRAAREQEPAEPTRRPPTTPNAAAKDW